MFEEDFRNRLKNLRLQKNVSARDMSLSIGQNPSYINRIENGIMMPSMSSFLFICDYLNISPAEFFNISVQKPERLRRLINHLENLDSTTFDDIATMVEHLATRN